MISTFHGIELAKRTLFAQQTAINTTGHNIANANTEGYSRQTVNFSTMNPMEPPGMNKSTMPGQLGQGVTVDSIQRARDTFIDAQYRNESQTMGDLSIQQETFSKLESIFNEPSEFGMRGSVDQFWASWQDLSRNPDNLTARSVVKENAVAMVDAFKYTDAKMSELKTDLKASSLMKANEANTMLEQIEKLNKDIVHIESLGTDNANDLRDQRDLLTDKLSKLMNINVKEQANGSYNISLTDGQTLLDQNGLKRLGEGVATNIVNIDSIKGGEIGGINKSLNEIVPEFQEQLDAMVQGLLYGKMSIEVPAGSNLADGTSYSQNTVIEVEGINGLHKLGWNLNQGAVGGVDLFTSKENYTSIQDLQVNPDIISNLSNIATSMRTEVVNGQPQVLKGNGDIALAIGKLRDAVTTFETASGKTKTGNFDDNFRSVIGDLGVKAQEINRRVVNQESIMNSVANRRDSIVGVSVDEEMANLIKFQHAYTATARVMTAVDEMLDTIISRMGQVGR
ncbi:flagellar hook-associated protein FlgK [Niallia taxi]|uniref:flagellar hook-associated protein FlgK n=1 Tax=Niallia taxi TaxID=2499688 RepID=UPI0015F6E83A|nr:flagellar hook-associated protein FlgK [Niallia taxi]